MFSNSIEMILIATDVNLQVRSSKSNDFKVAGVLARYSDVKDVF